MTGVEEAAALAALAGGAGTGAAAAGTGAALGAGALGAGTAGALGGLGAGALASGAAGAGAAGAGALTASEAAALGLTASQAGAASAAGLTAADLAGTGAAGAAGTGAGAGAAGSSGLLAGGASTAVPSLGYLAPEASSAAGSSGLLSGGVGAADAGALNSAGYLAPEMGQSSAPIVNMDTQAGLFDKANYATNGKLGAAKDWLAQKPLGNSSPSPSRGQLLSQGGKAMFGQQQQPQAAPAAPINMGPGQYVPVQQSSPYGASGPFHSTLAADGQPFIGMADYLNRRRFF